jgi:hypothetical protein
VDVPVVYVAVIVVVTFTVSVLVIGVDEMRPQRVSQHIAE